MRLFTLPNLFTLGNLLSGTLGIYFTLTSDYSSAYIYVSISVFLDFFDGFLARKLNIKGDLGKQLDSLADMVSFGVLPAMVMFKMLENSTGSQYSPFVAFVLPLFAALRLAKFNIDDRQSTEFYGLPTPAVALFIVFLPLSNFIYLNAFALILITVFLSVLMVSDLRLSSLKSNSGGVKGNIDKIIILLIFVICAIYLRTDAIPITILSYVVISTIKNFWKR